jgi:hypothetical protein
MDRERAETYLRLLAEKGLAAKDAWHTLRVVALALTATEALEDGTAEAIMADFDLAMNVRRQRTGHDPAAGWPAGGVAQAAIRAAGARIRSAHPPAPGQVAPGLLAPGQVAPGWPRPGRHYPATARPGPAQTPPGPAPGGAAGPAAQDAAGPERFIPVGRTIPFTDGIIADGVYLMAYAQTAAGARFTAGWRTHVLRTGPPYFGVCTVTDDRGRRYQLDFAGHGGGYGWGGVLMLSPDPAPDARWLEISAPGGPAVRIGLDPSSGVAATVSQASISAGEHLLTMIAERLLALAPDFPHEPGPVSPGLSAMAAGLSEVVAALEAAELLAPLSPLPGWLATVCANLRIDAPGLTAPPALDLPEQWLSLLAHYHRRKPGTAPAREGYAALAGALPEVDGIRLAFLGLENVEGRTVLHVLARGLAREFRHGPCGIDLGFPLSVWIGDGGGRWHLGHHPYDRHPDGGEDVLQLQLTPPLPRSAAWVEVLAAGRSARARARLPLRWGSL